MFFSGCFIEGRREPITLVTTGEGNRISAFLRCQCPLSSRWYFRASVNYSLQHKAHIGKRWNRGSVSALSAGAYTATLYVMVNRGDMNGRFQMQGGKNWIFSKEINANRFFWDSHWLEIWKNLLCPSMGPKGGSVAMDSELKGAGVHPPPSPARADFSIMIECTPEIGNCHSVCTLWSAMLAFVYVESYFVFL